ncbi:hypothetical protein GCM10023201_34450 [Actinomycetospora corticicola]|uniref:Actin-like ATPase involved in cell morphogenesis n=1 Tax=Actinomycetospora corticicola TaxID=663602 RepID=A0A7Y9E0U2_9PSEU|nr:Hsp70 family protein [Actinomycetospora corticicola]NYD38837.1 actin-like ATPase involved in cell morphogenesis [Actinomycetospora corticicola]
MTSPRPYRLGIDLGTTYTAAAVSRRSGAEWSEPEIVALGTRTASVPSVLHLAATGELLVGEAAERRAHTEPDRVVRQFKRRIGDDVPLVVGDEVHSAQALAARLARWVVDRVAEREGGPAEAIALTHPASWGDHKRRLLATALQDAGVPGTTFLPEPQAAAVAYAAKEQTGTDAVVGVYDLGGGTFDAAVVRRTARGFELPGRPEGIETLGGVDFDDRVVDHVRAGIGAAFDEIDPEDPDVLSALRRLRLECVEAKEALSADTEVTIPVMLPSIRENVRLTRHEFEAMIRSSLDHTVAALARTIASAGLSPDDLQAVLLVGGSSRIPLVAQMVSEELGRPVAVDADPKTSIAVGAVLAIAPRQTAPARRASAGASGANAAVAAAATSKLATGGTGTGPSSGLLDLRSAAAAAPARPVRSGPPAGPVPTTGTPSRFPPATTVRGRATGPGSGRFPAAPDVLRTGPGSGYFLSPERGLGPASGAFRSPADDRTTLTAGGRVPPSPADDRTTLTAGGRVPPRPPVAAPGARPDEEQPPAPEPRSRTRLLVTAAAAVVVVAALTTGGVVYARSASVSATVVPPTSAVPAPPPPAPQVAVAPVDAQAGVGAGSGSAAGGGSRGGSSGSSSGSGGSSNGSGGGSSGGSRGSSGHHGSGTTSTWPTTSEAEDTPPEPKPTPTS